MTQHIKNRKFTYRESIKINNWGYCFDSLLELKYAISIQDEFEFIRSRITIYYKIKDKAPTLYIREGVRHYTPDFLIRHKITGEAFLVEIKPRAAENESQLKLRKEVAENYIKWKKYDWKFKVVFDDEIILDEPSWLIYKECIKLKSKSSFQNWFIEQEKRYNISAPTKFAKAPSEQKIRFVLFGH